MSKRQIAFITSLFLVLSLFFSTAYGQKKNESKVLLIFDVSRSMGTKYGNSTRMEAAKRLAYQLIDSLLTKPGVSLALRVYGAQTAYPPGDCKDTKLVIPFGAHNSEPIKSYIQALQPTGITPIAYSLERAADDFKTKSTKNFIIIITDGIEECGGDICNAAILLHSKGIVLRPFIIGIGLTEEQARSFDCIGSFYDATEESNFTNLGKVIINQIMNPTSLQVNLLDQDKQPTETNVNMTFYNKENGNLKYNYIHTLDGYGKPDTLYIDPAINYSVDIWTIPPVHIDTAHQILGIHNILAKSATQGELSLEIRTGLTKSTPLCIVRQKNNPNTLVYQRFNTKQKYLCGIYDLEVMSLPKTIITGIEITPKGKTVTIDGSGVLQISTRKELVGSVMLKEGQEQRWVCNLTPGTLNHNIFLQPGKYILVCREKMAKETIFTIQREFTMVAGNIVSMTF
jgi:Ca-activated chloride channel family protein